MQGRGDFDVAIIGGGIVGLATAYKIARNHPAASIAVIEKEDRPAAHQTGHNSGVIHSGLYYKPGSTKAKTCAKGRQELVAFAKKHDIPHDICGKVIVATRKRELPLLDKLFETARRNRIPGIKKIDADQIKEIEPATDALAGLHVPCTGIIDFVAVAEKFAELVEAANDANKILLSHEVTGFEKHDFYTKILTSKQSVSAKSIINCAGLHCDHIARLDRFDPQIRIIPFRGDYYELSDTAVDKVKTLIYPVPDPAFPFLGVHFTRMIDGSVECGPNAVFSFKREGYGKFDFDLRDSWESLSYSGTWRLFLRNCRYGLAEYIRAISKRRFLAQLRRLIPSLKGADIRPGKSGVRAQALGTRGQLIDDFKIEVHGNCIHVLNAPSPAATASLAIGERISQIAAKRFSLPLPKVAAKAASSIGKTPSAGKRADSRKKPSGKRAGKKRDETEELSLEAEESKKIEDASHTVEIAGKTDDAATPSEKTEDTAEIGRAHV